jgi:large subunit ribosomal protein L22
VVTQVKRIRKDNLRVMGARKRIRAERIKAEKTTMAFAKLVNSGISPRKMRLVADLVRGVEVNKALNILQHDSKIASVSLGKLLRSAISNWEQKNEGKNIEEEVLYVTEIQVGPAPMLKRIQPAPQGRAHRIRKRSNHVTIVVDGKNAE